MGDLKNLQVKDLKLIMKKYNIKINRKKKNKLDLIEKILQRSNIVNQGQSEVKSLVDQLPKNYQIGKSPINSFYGESFNFIDMISKRWNFTEEHHLHRSWKTKFLISILRLVIINLWTFYSNFIPCPYMEFRNTLAILLRSHINFKKNN